MTSSIQYRKLDFNYTITQSCSILISITSNNANQTYNTSPKKNSNKENNYNWPRTM